MDPDAFFDQIAERLAPEGASTGSMFGPRALVIGGTSSLGAMAPTYAESL